MTNLINRWIIGSKYTKFHEDVTHVINVVEKYNLCVLSNNVELNGEVKINSDGCLYKTITDNGVVYNFFTGNLHINVERNSDSEIFSMYIKSDSDSWTVDSNEGTLFLSHPINKNYRVFICYDVPVLNVTRAVGENYKYGNWDRYVCKTFQSFVNTILSYTDYRMFNEDYKEHSSLFNFLKKK